ncbi:helix-turn-helix domain-containing protein [Streptacidiphilus sp. PAMC 29251]
MTESLGALLRGFRLRAEWTQQSLAERSGVSVHAISTLEAGRRLPRLSSLRRLADALNLESADRQRLLRAAATPGSLTATETEPARADLRPAPAEQAVTEPAATSGASDSTPGAPGSTGTADTRAPDGQDVAAVSAPPSGSRRPPWPTPAQLPADIPDFTGRATELAAVTGLLASAEASTRLIVVSGAPGVGKTSLATHAAHRLRRVFSDGTLFVDLHGAGPAPRDPADVLTSLLRSMGIPGRAIPDDPADRSALYRSLLADRAVLLVLDNAANSAQLRPLLPGGGPSAALVTSRASLAGLAGATWLELAPMSAPEAAALFAATAGRDRVAPDEAAVADVVASCGRLPLAVRIAGAKLASRPAWTVRHLADRLAGHRRMDELHAEDLDVRASLMLSYRGLEPAVARAFRLLAPLEYPAASLRTVAALLDLPVYDAERLLDRLLDAHLVTSPAPDYYGFHDLLRSFAKEQSLHEDEGQVRRHSLARAVRASLTDLAGQIPHPRPDEAPERADAAAEPRHSGPAAGAVVPDIEQDNLIAALMLLTSAPNLDTVLAAELLELLQRPLVLTGRWTDLSRCAAAVEQVAEGSARTTAHRVQARVAIHRDDRPTAHRLVSLTLQQARAVGDQPGEISSLVMLGTLHGRCGDHAAAAAALEQAVQLGQGANVPVQLTMAHNYAGETVPPAQPARHRAPPPADRACAGPCQQ